MKKLLLTLLLFFTVGIAAHAQEDNPLVINFSESTWSSQLGTKKATNSAIVNGLKYDVVDGYIISSNSLFLTKSTGSITLPAYSLPIEKIEITGGSGCATAATVTVSGSDITTTTTGKIKDVTETVTVNSSTAGVIYKIAANSSANAQIATIKIYFVEAGPVDFTFFNEYIENGLSLYEGATLTLPANAPSVSYNVEDTNVVGVVDGVLTALAADETNVTASWSETDAWKAGSASFAVTVTEAPLEATFDFVNDATAYATWPSGNINSLTQNGDCNHSIGKITLHVTGRFTIEDSSLKLYKALPNNSPKLDNGAVEISVPTGYYIKKVTIDATNPSYFGYTEPFVNEDQTINTKVYTHNGSSGGAYIKAITVEYAEKNGAVDFTFFNPYKESGVTIDVNKEFKFDLPDNAPEVTYNSSDAEIIAVSDDKTFTALKPGEAIVTASWNAVEGEWNAGSAEIKFTVNGLKPDMEFRDQVVFGKLRVGVVWEAVNVNTPVNFDRTKITYASSDESIVSVDSESGQILPADVHKDGVVTITATLPAEGDYEEGKASYTIVIVDPNSPFATTTAEFDFTTEDAYGMTAKSSTNNSGQYETEVTEILGIRQLVAISFDDAIGDDTKATHRLWQNTNGTYELRVLSGGHFTVSVPEGYKISKIGIVGKVFNGTATHNGLPDETMDDWEYDDVQYDWVPDVETPIEKVTFTVTAKTAQINNIYVMFEAANSNLKSAGLKFSPVINNLYVDEIANINGVVNPNGLDITYTIDNLDPSEYDIDVAGDGSLDVLVMIPGCYTLKATSPADETYRDGLAIMRLNVYRHLDVQEITATETKEHKYPDPIYTDEAVKVKIDVPELTTLYYKLVDLNSPATQADDVESDDENRESGFVEYEDEFIKIPANINGNLIFYIAAYGYKSPQRNIPLIHKVAIEEVEVAINESYIDSDEDKFDTNSSEEDLIFTMDVPAGYELHYAVAEGEGEAEYKLYEEPITVAAAHHGSLSFYITRGEYTSETRTISLDGLARLVDEASVTITHHHKFSMVTFEYTFKVENHASAEDPEFEMAVKDVFGNNLDVTEADFTKEEAAPVHVRAAEVAETEPGVKTYTGKIGVEGDDLGDKTKELTAELNVTVKGHPLFSLSKKIDDGMKTGIEDVTVDGAADAEFFTLEGIRVAQPEAGQLYIKRQGGVATKVLVK